MAIHQCHVGNKNDEIFLFISYKFEGVDLKNNEKIQRGSL